MPIKEFAGKRVPKSKQLLDLTEDARQPLLNKRPRGRGCAEIGVWKGGFPVKEVVADFLQANRLGDCLEVIGSQYLIRLTAKAGKS